MFYNNFLGLIIRYLRYYLFFIIKVWFVCIYIYIIIVMSKMPLRFQQWLWLYGGRLYTFLRFVLEPFWFIGAFFVFFRFIWRLLNRFIFSGFHPMKKWQICALLIVLIILLVQLFIFILSLSSMLVFLRFINNLIHIYFGRIRWNDKVMGRIKN